MKRLCLILLAIVITGVCAKEPTASGETAMAFLKLGQGARVCGMGEAFVGLADDLNAIYWNPAGLFQIEDRCATFMYLAPFRVEELKDMGYGYLATSFPTSKGVVGLSIAYYDYGEEDKYEVKGPSANPQPDYQGTWDAADFAATAALAGRLQKRLLIGGSVKFIRGRIDDETANGVACDIGVLYFPKIRGTTFGAVIKNIGTRIKFVKESDPLPLQLKVGLSHALSKEIAPVVVVLDATIPNDNNPYIGLGAEYNHRDIFAVRLGFSGLKDTGNNLTAGFGVNHRFLSFDFAYQPGGELGDSYFLSLSCKY
jgi:hypothetical protein